MGIEWLGSRQYHREKEPDYGKKLWCISDPEIELGFYKFYFTRNDSPYTACEKAYPDLTGLEFVGEFNEGFVNIESGSSRLILMRAIEAYGEIGFGFVCQSRQREMSDAELI